MYKGGTRVPDWNAATCMQSHPTRESISPTGTFAALSGKAAASPHTAKQGIQVRPPLVEHFRTSLEWIIHSGSPEHHMFSDASGSWGCGAWHGTKWFQLKWDSRTHNACIAVKELVPIIIGAVIWGKNWKGGRVLTHCDNSAVVSVINSRSCYGG